MHRGALRPDCRARQADATHPEEVPRYRVQQGRHPPLLVLPRAYQHAARHADKPSAHYTVPLPHYLYPGQLACNIGKHIAHLTKLLHVAGIAICQLIEFL